MRRRMPTLGTDATPRLADKIKELASDKDAEQLTEQQQRQRAARRQRADKQLAATHSWRRQELAAANSWRRQRQRTKELAATKSWPQQRGWRRQIKGWRRQTNSWRRQTASGGSWRPCRLELAAGSAHPRPLSQAMTRHPHDAQAQPAPAAWTVETAAKFGFQSVDPGGKTVSPPKRSTT